MKQVFFFAIAFVFAAFSCTSQTSHDGYTDLDVAAFKAKIAEPGIVLLDMRTPEETAQGMIEGAGQLDYEAPSFEAEVAKLDKSKTYLLYCRSGRRSGEACTYMAKQGFKNLYNLKGGYLAWTGKN
ncbi:MAG: rhodanese-like domain-containing protein [Saprospiraceae bacterium]|nr:rhodanese-like domain-containing protein [Saprospiraceae bacterium]